MSNSQGKLEVRYRGMRGKVQAIIVDASAGTIRFENCYVPRKLLAFTQPEFTCSLNDILEATETHYRRTSLTVVTKTGTGIIRKKSQPQWDQLIDTLQEIAATTPQGPVSTTLGYGVTCLIGAVFGFVVGFAAWSSFHPASSSNLLVLMYVWPCGAIGALLAGSLAKAADRRFGVRLVVPVLSVLGFQLGLGLSYYAPSAKSGVLMIVLWTIAGAAIDWFIRKKRDR